MVPTHSHPDGGLYSLIAEEVEGKDDVTGDWVPGVLYCDSSTRKTFWTSQKRWAERFTSLGDGLPTFEAPFHVEWEGQIVATFTFKITEVKDLRHMLITSGTQRSSVTPPEVVEQVMRVLRAQAEMIQKGLHDRELDDFPDLIGDVNRFHAKFGQEYLGKPRALPADLHDFRHKFHMEETHEYHDEYPKLVDAIERQDRRDILNCLEQQLDALVDAAWVILGTADLQFGRAAFIEAWRRVVRANMAKVLATDDPNAQDSGREVKYDIRKPAGWEAPDHRDLVHDNQIFIELFETAQSALEEPELFGFNQDATRHSDTRQV